MLQLLLTLFAAEIAVGESWGLFIFMFMLMFNGSVAVAVVVVLFPVDSWNGLL